MIEWILLVWLVVPGHPPAPAVEAGVYHQEARCIAARDSVQTEREDVGFIAVCVERDK